MKIVRRENESLESMLKRFRRDVNEGSILAEYKKHEFFTPKPVAARQKQQAAAANRRKYERIGRQMASRFGGRNYDD